MPPLAALTGRQGRTIYSPFCGRIWRPVSDLYLVYSVLLAIGFVLALPYYLWKGRSTGKYLASFRDRMGRLPAPLNAAGRPSIWIHAVSVGEVLAARALVGPLKERFPERPIFVSTTTATGNAVARQSVRAADGLLFAPFDWPVPVRRVLAALNPALLVLVETELWPNLIHEARLRGTRVALVNGRISPRSFPRYRRIRRWLRPMLAEVDLFLMQGEAHARRVTEMGAPPEKVKVTGNLKFDSLGETRTPEPLARLIGSGGPLWVAGSTAPGEEEMVLRAFREVRRREPAARLLLAPRHPERFAEAASLVEAAGLRGVRRTTLTRPWADEDVLVLDTLGELAQVYPLAAVVFVGGSLVPAGGHNVLEAAVVGKAVIVGPHMENFQEVADEFLAEGALVRVASASELAEEVAALLADPARRDAIGERARALIQRNRGALRGTVDALAGLVA
jgi:3-deoxy-D-manno-octulosonic-acid transferase